MAQEKSPTPEKQLLNLIENPNAQPSKNIKIKQRSLMSLFSPGAWMGRFSFFKGHSRQWVSLVSIQRLDIRLVNNALALLVVILSFYFIIDFSNSYKNLKGLASLKARVQQATQAKDEQVSTLLKTAAYYSELARKRDIFKIGARPDKTKAIRAPSDKLKEATKNLRMVGIAWSNDPDAMIEDTKVKRTYFLKRGQSLDNGVKVQAIFKDKIILSFENEEIEFK